MSFTTTGFLSSLVEAAATSIGTGIVIGYFLGATVGMLGGWSRKEVEARSLRDGYIGAVAALCIWLFDLFVGYAGSI